MIEIESYDNEDEVWADLWADLPVVSASWLYMLYQQHDYSFGWGVGDA